MRGSEQLLGAGLASRLVNTGRPVDFKSTGARRDELDAAEERLRMFLEQYWGGPTTYSERRGHPRLRMRHAPFAVTPKMRDHWLTHMRNAVDSLGLDPDHARELWSYLERAAYSMVNTFDEPPGLTPGLRLDLPQPRS